MVWAPASTVSVRGHPAPELGCLCYCDADLVGVKVSRAGGTILDQHGAGDAQLDQVRAVLDLLANGGQHGIGPVGNGVHAAVVIRARFGDRDESPRQAQARPCEKALLNASAHVKLELAPAAQVTDSSEAGSQVTLGILQDGQGRLAIRAGEVAIWLA